MAFFLIVPSVIIVSIFIVHAVAERFNFNVKYSSLILCSVMSFAINFAAIKMSTYLDKWHYVRLGALIIVASIIVTLINRFFIQNEEATHEDILDDEQIKLDDEIEVKEAEDIYEDVKALSVASTNKTFSKKIDIKIEDKNPNPIPIKPMVKSPVETAVKPKPTEKETTESTNKLVKEPPKVAPNAKSKKEATNISVKTISKPTESDNKNVAPKTDLGNKAAVQIDLKVKESKTTKDIEIVKADKTDKIDSLKTVNAKISEVIEKNSVKMDKDKPKKESPIATIDSKVNASKILDNKQYDVKANKKITDNADEINEHLNSLDDILDYAYAQKSNGNLKQAILAYQKALERYRNDEYAPFIAIDLGNIYKEQAAYSKVIKTYEEALKLPVVLRNASTYKEFAKNLAYLKIVQLVLLRHRALSTPFSKIPSQYFQEIETEFKATQVVR